MSSGIRAWRHDAATPAGGLEVSSADLGTFYSSASYCVHAPATGSIFIWVGEHGKAHVASADAQAAALCSSLNNEPSVTHEVQQRESAPFLALFQRGGVAGFTVRTGPADAGAWVNKPALFEPALLHIKGSRNVITRQVPCVATSLNAGDVFVLDVSVCEGGGAGVATVCVTQR